MTWLKSTLLTFLFAFSVGASMSTSLGFSETKKVFGTDMKLHGEGTRKATLFGIKVYHAAFYASRTLRSLPEILADPAPKRLDLKYLRDFGLDDTNEAWVYQFKESSGVDPSEIQGELDQLISFQKPIKAGDVLHFEFRPTGVTFFVNDERRGEILGKKFQTALLTIFFGPHPPTRELQRGLFRGILSSSLNTAAQPHPGK